MTFQEGIKYLSNFPITALSSISRSEDKIAPSVCGPTSGRKESTYSFGSFFMGEDYLKSLNLLPHSMQSSETQKADGRGAGLHRVGTGGLLAESYTPAAPPPPRVLYRGWSACRPAAWGPAPLGFSLDFFPRPVLVRVNPTDVINVASDLGSADFCSRTGVLHASSF